MKIVAHPTKHRLFGELAYMDNSVNEVVYFPVWPLPGGLIFLWWLLGEAKLLVGFWFECSVDGVPAVVVIGGGGGGDVAAVAVVVAATAVVVIVVAAATVVVETNVRYCVVMTTYCYPFFGSTQAGSGVAPAATARYVHVLSYPPPY